MKLRGPSQLVAPWLALLAACEWFAVVDPEVQRAVGAITISGDTLIVPGVGLERAVGIEVLDVDGVPFPDAAITWGSRNPSLVQVVAPGVVRSRALGESLVIASAGTASDTVRVVVAQIPASMSLTGPDTIWSARGRAFWMLAMEDSAGVDVAAAPTWSSSNPAVANAEHLVGDTSRVFAQGVVGEATLTASRDGLSVSKTIVVRQRATQMLVSYRRNQLNVGDTMSIQATVSDATSILIPDAPVQWTTSDSTVIRVSNLGLTTAVGGGTAIITVHSQAHSFSVPLTVPHLSPPLGVLRVAPATYLSDGFGEKIRLEAFVDDGVSAPVSVPAGWVSRNTSVATVDAYYATTKGNGTTWLVAQFDGRADSVALQVRRVPVMIDFQGPRTFAVTFSDGPSLYPLTRDRFGGIYQDAATTTWTIRDPSVAKVISTGVGAVAKGSTWVVVDLEGLRDSVHVTVVPQWGGNYTIAQVSDLEYFAELGIEDVRGVLRVENTTLTNLDGLETLRTALGPVLIRSNPSLTSMAGLRSLEQTGAVEIISNPNLTVALPALRVAGDIQVLGNRSHTPDAFTSLERVEQRLDIEMAGVGLSFPALEETGSFMIVNRSPASVALPELVYVANDLTVLNLVGPVALSAPRLWRVRSLTIQGNRAQLAFDLGSLTTLGRDLTVTNNLALANLADFGSITSGIRRIRIDGNAILDDVDALRRVGDALGSDPVIFEACSIDDNPRLGQEGGRLLNHLDAKFPGVGIPICD